MRGRRAAGMGGTPSAAFGGDAAAQGIHQVDDLGRMLALRGLDALALLFLVQQIPERVLVLIFEFFRMEVT